MTQYGNPKKTHVFGGNSKLSKCPPREHYRMQENLQMGGHLTPPQNKHNNLDDYSIKILKIN